MSETRPTGFPGWASGTSGAFVTTEPTATDKALGWQPNGIANSGYFNWLHRITYSWLKYLDEKRGDPLLGDGSDGDLTLGATIYVMPRSMMFGDITVGMSSVLDTNGFPLFARGTVTGSTGIIRSNGGQGGTGGTGLSPAQVTIGPGWPLAGVPAAGPLRGGWGGGTGATAPMGSSGTNNRHGETGLVAMLGAQGGSGGDNANHSQGAPAPPIGPSGIWRQAAIVNGIVSWLAPGFGTTQPMGVTSSYIHGGGGGGMGSWVGGQNSGFDDKYGGGGGAGGGVVLIACREINFKGTIQARGGAGGGAVSTGVGVAGNFVGCGGGGGGGGAVVIVTGAQTAMPTIDVIGGPGGPPLPASGLSGSTGFPGLTGVPTAYVFTF